MIIYKSIRKVALLALFRFERLYFVTIGQTTGTDGPWIETILYTVFTFQFNRVCFQKG